MSIFLRQSNCLRVLLLWLLYTTIHFKMLLEHKINILAEIAVVRFGQFFDSSDHIFIESDAHFGF